MGWSDTWNRAASQSPRASSPRRIVWLIPQSGWGFRTGMKPNSAARSSTSGYWVTTATAENSSDGNASRARRISVFPSKSAASLFSPNRRASPAAMTTQPIFIFLSSLLRFLQIAAPAFHADSPIAGRKTPAPCFIYYSIPPCQVSSQPVRYLKECLIAQLKEVKKRKGDRRAWMSGTIEVLLKPEAVIGPYENS